MIYDKEFFNAEGCRPSKLVVLKEDMVEQLRFLLTVKELADVGITQAERLDLYGKFVKYSSEVLWLHLTWK